MERFIPFIGYAVLIGLCLLFSKHRQAALKRWPLIVWALILQFTFAIIILRTGPGQKFFVSINDFFMAIINATAAGAGFVFGDLILPPDAERPYLVGNPIVSLGFFAFGVLPTIIFFSSLTAVLYHYGILQVIVKGIAWVMAKTMKTSGAETLSASANIFIGQTEAPLLVRPFIPTMTKSELMTVMTGGFATVAGGVMAAYVGFLYSTIPNIAGHLLAASVMAAPAGLMFSKLIVPETETPVTMGDINLKMDKVYDNGIDAAAGGASEGMRLAINVAAMLIAFLALIALFNSLLGWLTDWITWPAGSGVAAGQGLTLEVILGWIFWPFAWLMGIPKEEAIHGSSLMGLKMVANEFVAYLKLGAVSGEGLISPRSRVIMSYALCGFANLGSIGIQIGGLAIMAPERRGDLARLGPWAMIAGTFATMSTACIAGVLYKEPKPPIENAPQQLQVEPLTSQHCPIQESDDPNVFVYHT